MFSIFKLKNSHPLSIDEDRYVRMMLKQSAESPGLSWLNDPALQKVRFFFSDEMTVESGICGAFTPLHPHSVFLLNISKGYLLTEHRPTGIEYTFPTIVHELRHCWQFHKHPLLYMLGSIPGIREFTIESDARKTEQFASEFSEAFIRAADQKNFERRCHEGWMNFKTF